MHPALSVIFFTVLSGAGFGFVTLFVIAELFAIGGPVAPAEFIAAAVVGFALVTVGLLLSTGHLANPRNAWRSFSRFRSSWLSREAVFSVIFYPLAALYVLGMWWLDFEHSWWTVAAGVLTVLLAQISIFCTGMIYACLKTIPEWNNSLVPLNYMLIGLALGGLALTVLRAHYGAEVAPVAGIALVLVLLAAIAKGIYYFWIGTPRGNSIQSATGLKGREVKLLDVGHTAQTFLTEEFGYEVPAARAIGLRTVVLLLGFVLPAVMLALVVLGAGVAYAWVGALSALLGMLVERWLFFAEARHVVNLYHGRQRV